MVVSTESDSQRASNHNRQLAVLLRNSTESDSQRASNHNRYARDFFLDVLKAIVKEHQITTATLATSFSMY